MAYRPTAATPGRRARNRAAQRQRILEGARTLFAARGLDSVTMAEVAAEAGVSRATVFNHFGSKRALIEGITVEVLEQYQTELDRTLADRESPTADQIRHLFVFMGEGIEQQPDFHQTIFRELARMLVGLDEGGPGHAARKRNLDSMLQIVTRGQARGEITRAHRAEDLAGAIDGVVFGTITHWLYDDPSEPLGARMLRAAEVLLAPVAVEPERGSG